MCIYIIIMCCGEANNKPSPIEVYCWVYSHYDDGNWPPVIVRGSPALQEGHCLSGFSHVEDEFPLTVGSKNGFDVLTHTSTCGLMWVYIWIHCCVMLCVCVLVQVHVWHVNVQNITSNAFGVVQYSTLCPSRLNCVSHRFWFVAWLCIIASHRITFHCIKSYTSYCTTHFCIALHCINCIIVST